MPIYAITSIALNYLPKARVMFSTLRKFHPDWKLAVIIVDEEIPELTSRIEQMEEFDEAIYVSSLEIGNGEGGILDATQKKQWLFKHNIVEACTAVKGSAVTKILSRADCASVFYFDPDMLITDRLDLLTDYFEKGHSILLTPHGTEPETRLDAIWDNEVGALRWGIYNLGFLGIKNDEEGNRFVKWWKDRLDYYCYEDLANGVFTDQSWCDMAPAFFDGVKILRDPQFNVATWNLTHRHISGDNIDNMLVNGKQKLAIFHFSGFDKGAQLIMLKKYGSEMAVLFALREWYIAACESYEDPTFSGIRWSYGHFENGETISTKQRGLFRTREDLQKAFLDPFASGDHSYQAWYASKEKHEYMNDMSRMHRSKVMTMIFKRYRRFRYFFQKN